ncbi:dephospho-CoA kinase [Psychrobium sp. 1_MG-2023]|uniref:dephospho-CoA kinase n=1 Tax=Psychrobium sp. 1_MG-2023 TaxID=3062624 RepID=UPI000C33FFD6|nr:dephospho-CoA kinase [Psychrobium sp. 1_MG-2023]MDP2562033.1 dephospho-CoA kinase [Psychrobium sp. 1_MG-2023]PKF58520.1 dephospho-CoA kinase [Alteromonadales bacterium alter-6D02]
MPADKKYIVGLTGGIASGKTTVANLFMELGIDVVDADIVAREVVAQGTHALNAIAKKFGDAVIDEQGELKRSELRRIVFADNQAKAWLNELLHPIIRQEITRQLQQTQSTYCLLVAPLLIENNIQTMVNRVLIIDASEQQQLKRTMERDGCDEAQAQAIMSSQLERNLRLSHADDIIENTGMINKLTNDVKKLHHSYLERALEGTGN